MLGAYSLNAALTWLLIILTGLAIAWVFVVKRFRNDDVRNHRWLWGGISALVISYPFTAFFHSMGDITWILLGLGVLACLAAWFAKSPCVIVGVLTGYIMGFALGIILGGDYCIPEQGGCVYNNSWQIWVISFFAFIGVGIAIEIVSRIFRHSLLQRTFRSRQPPLDRVPVSY